MPTVTTCTRCGEFFKADTAAYAINPRRVCGGCAGDLRDDADAERLAAECEAAGRQIPDTDLF